MRVAFFGSSRFSCMVLGRLLASAHEIAAVVTQPDQPAGRRMTLCSTEVCGEAEALGLPVLKPENLRNNAEFRAALLSSKADALLVASYGQMIPAKVLKLTEWPLNVHPSLLPKLRGASPIRTALLQGLAVSGCCVMRMTPRMDDGDLLCAEEQEIGFDWNYERLESELGTMGGELAIRALDAIGTGSAKLTPQDHSAATYCSTHTREDTWIDWSQPAERIYNFIRAWDPDFGALTQLADGRRLKIWEASYATLPEGFALGNLALQVRPGSVVAVTPRAFWVMCGDGQVIQVNTVQPDNRPRMSAANYVAGYTLDIIGGLGSVEDYDGE